MSGNDDDVCALVDAGDEGRFGGKAVQLGAARRNGLPVPDGIALATSLVDRIASGDPHAVARVREAFSRVTRPCAVRSSAVGEDSAIASFAGQHATLLNVADELGLIEAIVDVWRSARSDAAMSYRHKLGVASPPRMGVVIQSLVDSDCAGVLFTRNPMTGADERVIEAAWGLGEIVVAGLVTPDHFRVARDGRVLERTPGEKDIAIRRDAHGGTAEQPVDEARVSALCLTDAQLAELHGLASRCEACFGPALDLEWAYAEGTLYLLQQRKITRIS